MKIEELKKDYTILAKKYRLPEFSVLNDNFEIEKIDRECVSLLRLIRKVMMEKVVNSMGFVESLLNPVNAPRMYISYLRSVSAEDRKMLDEIYDSLARLSLESLDLEIDYSEKKEAEMISKISSIWDSLRPKFRKIISNIKKPNIISTKKEKTYFG